MSEPPTDDPDEVALWLQGLLGFAMSDNGTSALVDLGGGDTSLSRLLRTMPDLSVVMDKSPVAPVAVHVVGTDEHDLVPLAAMEEAGFTPKATAIVFNEMIGTRPEFAARHCSTASCRRRYGAEPSRSGCRSSRRPWSGRLTPADCTSPKPPTNSAGSRARRFGSGCSRWPGSSSRSARGCRERTERRAAGRNRAGHRRERPGQRHAGAAASGDRRGRPRKRGQCRPG